MGRRGKEPPVIWATSGGFVADHEPKLTRDEAGAILRAEIPAEAWNRIHQEVALLNIWLSDFAEAPRVTMNPKDPRAFEPWRQRTLEAIERREHDLRGLKRDHLKLRAARSAAMENELARLKRRELARQRWASMAGDPELRGKRRAQSGGGRRGSATTRKRICRRP